MAINIPIITSLEDTGIKNAKAAFNDFKSAVGKAEGGMGKFKAGSKVALDAVKANAATFAIAGGVAFAKFAADGVKAFQELALNAEKFATATGLAIEDASRYMEVGADIGIPIDAVQGAIGRLNKTIGADPDKVRDLGVDLVYLADGSLDVNETFLNTIDRIKGIKDPAEKARVAAQLLGKGWQSMSTLIEMGADDLSTALGNVSDSKVIDPKELQKAKEFRDAMDQLKDQIDDVTLAVGEGLVPVLTDVAGLLDKISSVQSIFKNIPGASWVADHVNMVSPLLSAYDLLSTGVSNFFGLFSDEKEVIPVFAEDMSNARAELDLMKDAIKRAKNPLKDLTDQASNASVAFVNADTAWKNLTDSLDQEVALDNAKTKLAELEAAAKLAFGSGAQADIDAYEQQAAEFVGMLSAISGAMDGISSKEILIRYKTQGPAAALELAGYLARGAEYGGLSPEDALGLAGISTLPRRAMGGPVAGGSTYLVGERGPELFTPTSSGNITANSSLGGGGNTVTINVNGGDPMQVVKALQTYVRTIGPVPVNTRTM
jgi:hypothetical protein